MLLSLTYFYNPYTKDEQRKEYRKKEKSRKTLNTNTEAVKNEYLIMTKGKINKSETKT